MTGTENVVSLLLVIAMIAGLAAYVRYSRKKRAESAKPRSRPGGSPRDVEDIHRH